MKNIILTVAMAFSYILAFGGGNDNAYININGQSLYSLNADGQQQKIFGIDEDIYIWVPQYEIYANGGTYTNNYGLWTKTHRSSLYSVEYEDYLSFSTTVAGLSNKDSYDNTKKPGEKTGLNNSDKSYTLKTKVRPVETISNETIRKLMGDKTYSDIYIRLTCVAKSKQEANDDVTKEQHIDIKITVYNCNAGVIKPDINKNPNINNDEIPVYAIYNDQSSKNDLIPILNDQSPNIYIENGTQYLYYQINGYDFKSIPITRNSNYGINLYMKDLGLLNDDDEVKISRTSNINNISCISNSITFRAIPTVSLPNIRTSSEINDVTYICPAKTTKTPTQCGGEETTTLNGRTIDFSNNKYKDFYGIRYGWEYSLDANSWNEYTENLNKDTTNSILCLANKNITTRMYFRQYVVLNTFGKKIYASAMGNINEYMSYIVVEPYLTISESLFKIKGSTSICKNQQFSENEGNLEIVFTPKYPGANYNYIQENKFKYKWTYFNETTYTDVVLPTEEDKLHISDIMTASRSYSATVTDGCNTSVNLTQATITVNPLPVLEFNEITLENCSYNENSETYSFDIEIKSDEKIALSIPIDYTQDHDYYLYIQNSDNTNIIKKLTHITTRIDAETIYNAINEYGVNAVYIKKISKNGCESNSIRLNVNLINDITNNVISLNSAFKNSYDAEKNIVYVCYNTDLPSIDGTSSPVLFGGYSTGNYSYMWEWSENGSSWQQISATDLTSPNLGVGLMKVTSDILYIRRTVKSISSSDVIESNSNIITIRTYQAPSLHLLSSKDNSTFTENKLDLCYNSKAYFRCDLNSDFEQQYKVNEKLGETIYTITYDDGETPSSQTDYKKIFTKNATITASRDFCNSKITTTNSIDVIVKEDLTVKDAELTYSNCILEGTDVTVSFKVHAADYEYFFISEDGDTLSKEYSAKIRLPETVNNTVSFSVAKIKDGCYNTTLIDHLTPDVINKRLNQEKLYVIGAISTDNSTYNVCKDANILIKGSDDDNETEYKWTINNLTIEDKTKNIQRTFDKFNSAYTVIRERNHKYCTDMIRDTITIKTRPKLESSSDLVISEPTLCNNDSVRVSMINSKLTGGSGDYSYVWSSSEDGNTFNKVSINEQNDYIKINSLSSSTYYKLFVQDNVCNSYYYEFTPAYVEVKPSIEILRSEIEVTPEQFSIIDGNTEYSVSVKDNCKYSTKTEFYLDNELVGTKVRTSSGTDYNYSISDSLARTNSISYCLKRILIISDSKKCESNMYCNNILANKGFTSAFLIKTINGSNNCPNSEITIETESLPYYDGAPLATSSIRYQWMKRYTNSSTWATIPNANSSTLNVYADELGTDYVYACKLTYTPDASTSETSIYSNSITINGYKRLTASIVNAIWNEEKTSTISICKGSSIENLTVSNTFSSDTIDQTSLKFQWYTKKSSESEWKKVEDSNIIVGSTTNSLSWSDNNIQENTLLRCLVTDRCGNGSFSSNYILISINNNATISSNNITMLSSKIIDTDIDSLSFSIPSSDSRIKIGWFYNAEKTAFGNPITFNKTDGTLPGTTAGEQISYYEAGSHTINVFSINNAGCSSDTIQHTYTLYNKLQVTGAFSTRTDTLCPSSSSAASIILNEITGGSGVYSIDWYYKTNSMSSFVPLNNENVNFYYVLSQDSMQINKIKGLEETTSFYARISSPGYPGKSITSAVATIYVYRDIESGTIDNVDELACFGTYISINNKNQATGGSGVYTYNWIKSIDGGISWSNIEGQNNSNYIPNSSSYNMYENTLIKRIVTDDICRISDTTNSKSFYVSDQVIIDSMDISAPTGITSGEKAYIYGTNENYSYIWYEQNGFHPIDTTKGTNPFISDNLYAKTTFLTKKVNQQGCKSDNFISTTIRTYEKLTGGIIEFSKFPKVDEKIAWICSGSSIGQISNFGDSPSGINLSYEWYYCTSSEANCNNILKSQSGVNINTETVDMDTCSLVLNNIKTGKDLIYYIYRITYSTDQFGNVSYAYSDTLSLHVAPTLASVNTYLIDNVAGELSCDKLTYCPNTSGNKITHNITESVYNDWMLQKFGALPYNNNLTVYWEQATGSGNSVGEWTRILTNDFTEESRYTNAYSIENVDKTYSVRLTIDDGCSSISSNIIPQKVIAIDDVIDSLFIINKGVEEGDDIKIIYNNIEWDCNWYNDASGSDTITKGIRYISLNNVSMSQRLYLQLEDSWTKCKSDIQKVPLVVYPESNGGSITQSQITCKNAEYKELYNIVPASGSNGDFEYQWQISTNLDMWNNIDGATDKDIDQTKINESARYQTQYIRRKATSSFGREVYSDTLKLDHYSNLIAGQISFADSSLTTAFCSVNNIPLIKTTQPTGGKSGAENYPYKIGWEYAINNNEYKIYSPATYSQITIDPNLLILLSSLNREVNNTIKIRAIYEDKECEQTYSNVMEITLYRKTVAPSIYQRKDSCEAERVTVIVEDQTNYNYMWFVQESDGTTSWEQTGIFEKVLTRSNEFDVLEYGIIGSDTKTGCKTDITYFNLDSLPILTQTQLKGIDTVCYNSNITLQMEEATGGSGDKAYQWQYSYDKETFFTEEGATQKDLKYSNIKTNTYFRRIVNDMCSSDTSNTVEIFVRKDFMKSDVIFSDRKCENQKFKASMKYVSSQDSLVELDQYRWYVYDANTFNLDDALKTHEEGIENDNITKIGYPSLSSTVVTTKMIPGFEGDYHDYIIMQMYKDPSIGCYSQTIKRAYTATKIEQGNIITCEQTTPCNNSIIKINGDSVVMDSYNDNFTFYWQSSKDNITWNNILLKYETSADIEIVDTMYIKRITNNGCIDYESNVITFVGQKRDSVDYEHILGLSYTTIISDTTDSVISYITATQEDLANYSYQGDGIMPSLSHGNQILPYSATTYKDKTLYLEQTNICTYRQQIKPLSGGKLALDGEEIVCAGNDMPKIVATETEGGSGDKAYQWQYKNIHTNEYVNIDGAVSKNYTPTTVDVPTSYRRITTCGMYSLVSNNIDVEIRTTPIISDIIPDIDTLYYNSHNIHYTNNSIEKAMGSNLKLKVKLENTILGKWQSSKDKTVWNDIELAKVVKDSDYIIISDTTVDVLYIRYAASNNCVDRYSNIFAVEMLKNPIIFIEDLDVKDNQCYGSDVYVRCYDNNLHTTDINSKYRYRYSGYEGKMVDAKTGEEVTDTTLNLYGVYLKNVTAPFSLKITRVSLATGISSDIYADINVSSVKSMFDYIINEVTYTSDQEATIQQGDLVTFINRTEGDNTYYWELIESLNPQYSSAPYGLYSTAVNPQSFFYNGGHHKVKLISTNKDGCSDTLIANAIYVDESTLRSSIIRQSFFWEGESLPTENEILIYPNPVSDYLNISSNEEIRCIIQNTLGEYLVEISGSTISIDMRNYPANVYLLRIGNRTYKVIKK